jgi:hypothetical protein
LIKLKSEITRTVTLNASSKGKEKVREVKGQAAISRENLPGLMTTALAIGACAEKCQKNALRWLF